MSTHEKLDRKALAAPDEFQVVSRSALDWANDHRNVILAGAGALLALGIVASVIASQRQQGRDAAAVAFSDAHKQFAASKFADAAGAFQKVATDRADTSFGRLAVLYRAHALARQGDAAGAASAYDAFLATHPSDYLRQEALLGLANAKLAAGDQAGALTAYDQSRGLAGPFKTDAALGAARLQDSQGHADAARAIYLELLKDSGLDGATRASVLSKLPVELRPADTAPPKS